MGAGARAAAAARLKSARACAPRDRARLSHARSPPAPSQWATLTFFVIVSAMVDLMFGDDSQVRARARRAFARGVVCVVSS